MQISNLSSQLDKMKQEKEATDANLKRKESELTELEQIRTVEKEQFSASESELQNLMDEKVNQEKVLKSVREEMEIKLAEITDLRNSCVEYSDKIMEYEDKIRKFETTTENLTLRLSETESALSSERNTLAEKDLAMETLMQANACLNEDLAHIKECLEEKLTEIRLQSQNFILLEQKCQKLEIECQENQEVNKLNTEKLQVKLHETEEELQLRQSQVKKMENTIDDLKNKLSHTFTDMGEIKNDFEKDAATLKSKLDLLQMDVEDREDVIQNLTTQLDNLNATVKNLTEEKNTLLSISESTANELCEIKAALAVEIDNVAKCRMEEDRLGNIVADLQNALSLTKAQLKDKEDSLSTLQLECEKNLAQLNQVSENLQKTQEEKEFFEKKCREVENVIADKRESYDSLVSETDSLKQKCAKLQDELETAHHNIEEHLENITKAGQQIKRLEAKLAEMESAKKTLENSSNKTVDELQAMLVQKAEELTRTTALLGDAQLHLSDLQAKFNDSMMHQKDSDSLHRTEISNLSEKLDVLQKDLETKNVYIERLMTEKLNFQSALSELSQERETLQTKSSTLDAENRQLHEANEDMSKELEKHTGEIGELKKTLSSFELKISQLTSMLQSKEQQCYTLDAQLTEALKNVEDCQQKISILSTELTNVEMSKKGLENKLKHTELEKSNSEKDLGRDLEQTKLKLQTAEEELEAKSSELATLQTHYDNMNRSVSKTNGKISELQVEKNALVDQIDELKKVVEDLKSELLEKNATMAVLREELDNTVLENESLRNEKSELLAQEEKYKHTIHELEVRLTDTEIEIESTKESFESVSVQRFDAQNKLRAALREKDDVEKRLQDREAELFSAQSESERLNSVEIELEDLKRELLKKDDMVSDLKVELDNMAKKCGQLALEIENFQKEKIDLEENLQLTVSRNEELEKWHKEISVDTCEVKAQLLQLQEVIKNLTSNLEAKQKEILKKVNELDAKEIEISRLQSALDEKVNEIRQLTEDNVNLKKELKDLNCTVGTLQDAIESLNYDLNLAEQQKLEIITDGSSLKTENSELKCKLSEISLELAEMKANHPGKKQVAEELEITNQLLVSTVESLKRDNNALTTKLNDVTQTADELNKKLQSMQVSIDEKVSSNEKLVTELQSALSENESSLKSLQSSQDTLKRVQDSEKNLHFKVQELNYTIISLTRDIEDKNFAINELQTEIESLRQKDELWEKQKNNILMEQHKKLELAEVDKANLNEKLTELEMQMLNMKNLEEKARLYDRLLTDTDKLKEEIMRLKPVEKEMDRLKQSLSDKEVDFQSLLDAKVLLESSVLKLQTEIENQKDMLRTKDKELVSALQEKLSVEKKQVELREVADENIKLKDQIRYLEEISKSKDKELENLREDNMEMEKQFKLGLSEKEIEIQSLMDAKVLLENNVQELENNVHELRTEIKSQKDMLRTKDKELAIALQEKLSIEKKRVELGEVSDENIKLKDQIRCLEELSKSNDKELWNLREDKLAMEKQLKNLQKSTLMSDSSETQWEQQCSTLTQKLGVEQKKVQSLTEQLNSLKGGKVNTEEMEALKEELAEAISDMEFYKEHASELMRQTDELTEKNKSLKFQNEILQVKVKHFRSQLKNDASASSGHCQQTGDKKESAATATSSVIFEQKNTTSTEKEELKITAQTCIEVQNLHTELKNGQALKTGTVLQDNQEDGSLKPAQLLTPSRRSPCCNPCSPLTKSSKLKPFRMTPSSLEKKQSHAAASGFKSPLAKETFSLEKEKHQLISKLASPRYKAINASKPLSSPSTSTGLADKLLRAESMKPPKNDLACAKRILPDTYNATKNVDLPKHLSPRVTRSSQKRQSTDLIEESGGGKKMKLITEKLLAESTSASSKKPSKLQKIKPIRQMVNPIPVTKPNEILPSSTALATITNSPKKTDRIGREAPRPRGLSRLKSPKHKQPVTVKEAESKPNECNTQ
ncbi:hypothetical protein Btru_055430 [Bulinus truncatus]|nr:hypothetical protein Btru_055430 [Bulinus truncatus]